MNNLSSFLPSISKLLGLLTPKEKKTWIRLTLFALSVSLLEMLAISFTMLFAQVLYQPESGKTYVAKLGFSSMLSPGRIIASFAIFYGLFYALKNLVALCETFSQSLAVQKLSLSFRARLLERYSNATYALYLSRNSSFGMAVVGSDTEVAFSTAMLGLAIIFSDALTLVCLVIMIMFAHSKLAFLVFGLIISLGFITNRYVLPKFYTWGKKIQESTQQCNQTLLEFFQAFKELILFNKRQIFISSYQSVLAEKLKWQALQTVGNSIPRVIVETLFICVFMSAIVFLCWKHETPGQILGILGGYFYIGFRFMPSIIRIVTQVNIFKSSIPSIDRLHQEYHTVGVQKNYLDIPEFSFQEAIEFKDLCFHYESVKTNALSNINLTIKKEECIGIIGETGSGKSTFIDIVLGLLQPQQGVALIDHRYPLNTYQWHEHIGYVPQMVYLIDSTIASNIAFGEKNEDIDEIRLNQAILEAQLTPLIKKLPEGVKTVVGERGMRLSGGERQRIAIARALYRDPKVLIFDEATSALDNETEERLMETIDAVARHRTVIMVAHRLTTLKNCHRIVRFKDGSIQEITHYDALTIQQAI